jgi:uncharacterized membrane protein YiaA
MAFASVVTPVAVGIELLIFIIGMYAGYAQKKMSGYFFGVTFLLFALFDTFCSLGYSEDTLAAINIVAILFALGGVYFLVRPAK